MQYYNNCLKRKRNRKKSTRSCWYHGTKKKHYYNVDHIMDVTPSHLIKFKYDQCIRSVSRIARLNNCSKKQLIRHDYDKKINESKKYLKKHDDDIIIKLKIKNITKVSIKKDIKDICSICCNCSDNIYYINCKKKCIQNVNFGKYRQCCKDKTICKLCLVKCRDKCPFCMNHRLYPLKRVFKKKKPPFAIRMIRLKAKKLKKEREKKKRIEKDRHLNRNYNPNI